MNKLWNKLYSLDRPQKEREHKVRDTGKGYEKVKQLLAANGLEFSCNYRKWYNIYDNGNNVRYAPFDTMSEVKEWIKTEMDEYLKTRERK